MSPEVIAALVGVVVGIVANRLADRLGRLWCKPTGWKLRFMNADGEIGIERADEVTWLDYSFALDLFNGRDIPTGLRNLKVILVCEDGKEVRSEPADRASVRPGASSPEEMSVINLPPRKWVHKEFVGTFHEPEGINVGKWQRADLVGEWPRRWRKKFRKKIAERQESSSIHRTAG